MKLSYLKMLREWERGGARNSRTVEVEGHKGSGFECRVKQFVEDGSDEIIRFGEDREDACGNCYDAAVKRGIIKEVPGDASAAE